MRKALGRGLEALLPPAGGAAGGGLREVELDQIDPNRAQPRHRFEAGPLEELVASIKANGVLQPLLVRRDGERFRIVAGERRWRAAQLAGLQRIPVIVRELSDTRALELALVENLQREDLSPIEEAGAYQQLLQTHGLSQEEIAARVGKARASVANALRLLKLPAEIREALDQGSISPGHAKALLMLDGAEQRRLFQRILKQGLSVRAAEALAGRAQAAPGRTRKRAGKDRFIRAAEQELHERLGTPVRIIAKAGGKGRIEIDYTSPQELDRLYKFLLAE